MTTPAPLLSERLLEQLAQRWRTRGAPVVTLLQPGLSRRKIDAATAPLGLQLPVEARTWWQWHNGVDATQVELAREREIVPGLEFLPLEEAVARCWRWREVSQQWHDDAPGVDPDPWWAASWFPITDAGQAGIIACDCATADGDPTPIRCVYPPEPGSPVSPPVLNSLGELVQGWIEGFDSGAWDYENGWLATELRPRIQRQLFG